MNLQAAMAMVLPSPPTLLVAAACLLASAALPARELRFAIMDAPPFGVPAQAGASGMVVLIGGTASDLSSLKGAYSALSRQVETALAILHRHLK
jgi:hypothetical protein